VIDFLNRVLDWLISNDITASEVVLNTLIAIACIAIIISMWNLHRANGRYQNINLVDLIVSKEGRLDGAKCVEMGTFLLMSWGFVVYVTAKALPEWYMQAFLFGFVLRGAYGAYLRSKGGPPETLGTVTETTIKTKEVTVDPPDGPMPVEIVAGAGVKQPLKVRESKAKK